MTTTQLLAEIDRYEKLPPNYDGEGSEPPTAETCERSREFVRMYGERMKPDDSMQLLNGNIGFDFERGNRLVFISTSSKHDDYNVDAFTYLGMKKCDFQPVLTATLPEIGHWLDWLEGKVTA